MTDRRLAPLLVVLTTLACGEVLLPDAGPQGGPDGALLDGSKPDTGASGGDAGSDAGTTSDAQPTDAAAPDAQTPIDAGPNLVRLVVQLAGAGEGRILGAAGAIDCPGRCEAALPLGSSITLTAEPAIGSTFGAWTDGCAGTGPCDVQLDADLNVGARFDLRSYPITVTFAGDGAGLVTSAPPGLQCSSDCQADFIHGTTLELLAAPNGNDTFGGWSGDCGGTGLRCAFTVTSSRAVGVAFDRERVTINVSAIGTGGGTIRSDDGLIDCPAVACAASYPAGTQVRITAQPDATSTFEGWLGNPACAGTLPCTLALNQSQSVSGNFQRITHRMTVTFPSANTGAGTVVSAPIGISCPPTCAADFVTGTQVSLEAQPDVSSYLARWTGGCAGTDSPCLSAPVTDTTVQVHFHEAPVDIVAGGSHACARFANGDVRCWGSGFNGVLGYGSANRIGDHPSRSVASAGLVPVGVAATEISAGDNHTCVRTTSDQIRCWGSGTFGRLGYGSEAAVGDGVGPFPSIVSAGDVPLPSSTVPTALNAGPFGSCILERAWVRCWGYNPIVGIGIADNVGDGMGPGLSQVPAVPLGPVAAQVGVGYAHACAVTFTGGLRCWGEGLRGQLGYNDTAPVGGLNQATTHAATDVPVGASVQAVGAGYNTTCALLVSGAVRCWGAGGENNFPTLAPSRLGYDFNGDVGSGATSIIQAGDVPVGATAVQLSMASGRTCVRLQAGSVRCWGGGNLGYQASWVGGAQIGPYRPISIIQAGDLPLPAPARHIAVGGNFTCAILINGDTICWGENQFGQLGLGHTESVGSGSGTYPTIASGGKIQFF